MSLVQIKLLAAILGLLAILGGAYFYQMRRNQRPAYVLSDQDKARSQKLLPKEAPKAYLEP